MFTPHDQTFAEGLFIESLTHPEAIVEQTPPMKHQFKLTVTEASTTLSPVGHDGQSSPGVTEMDGWMKNSLSFT